MDGGVCHWRLHWAGEQWDVGRWQAGRVGGSEGKPCLVNTLAICHRDIFSIRTVVTLVDCLSFFLVLLKINFPSGFSHYFLLWAYRSESQAPGYQSTQDLLGQSLLSMIWL